MQFENYDGLIGYTEDGTDYTLGYLATFQGHGIFDASLGKVDVTPDDATKHNQVLDAAIISGLDDNCEIGQGNVFYLKGNTVTTWLGTHLGDAVISKNKCTFTRNGKTFTAKLKKDEQAAAFIRTA